MHWVVAGYAAALFAGQYEGSGNTCIGKLSVEQATLSWRTADSNCSAVPYKVIEQDQRGTVVLQLEPDQKCGFHVIKLEADSAKPDGWTVTGFVTLADFKNPRLQPYQRLECKVRKLDSNA
jgi:hypothetical protein